MGFQAVAGEAVIKEGAANYEKGWETVGGTLQLTTHRLFFESHKLNIHTGAIGIDLREVVSVRKCFSKFFGLIPMIPGAVGVKVKGGREHRFVVSLTHSGSWLRAIEGARKARR